VSEAIVLACTVYYSLVYSSSIYEHEWTDSEPVGSGDDCAAQ